MTKPQSYPILLQLPPRQLESVFEVSVRASCVFLLLLLEEIMNVHAFSSFVPS